MKHIRVFYLEIFSFLAVKFSMYLNRRVFVIIWPKLSSLALFLFKSIYLYQSYCYWHHTDERDWVQRKQLKMITSQEYVRKEKDLF